jgi:hypothetical protein
MRISIFEIRKFILYIMSVNQLVKNESGKKIKYTTDEKILLKNRIESITDKSVLLKILTEINGKTSKTITVNNQSTYIFFESIKESIYPVLSGIVDDYLKKRGSVESQILASIPSVQKHITKDPITNTKILGELVNKDSIQLLTKSTEKKRKRRTKQIKNWVSKENCGDLATKLKENKQTQQINLDSLKIDISTLESKRKGK